MSIVCMMRRLSKIADTEATNEEEQLAHGFLIYLGTFMSIGGLIWGTVTVIAGLQFQSIFPYSYALITLLNFIYLHYSKNFLVSQNIQVFISLMLPFLFQIFLGGIITSGGVILWSILTILGSFTFQEKKYTIRWFGVYLLLVIISGLLDQLIPMFNIPLPHVPVGLSVLFFSLNVTLISIIIFSLFYYFADTKEKLQATLRDLANTDPLTELPNRRSFFRQAENEFSRAKRYGCSFSVMMIDIDFFKKINDTYGHAIGDEVLRKFGALLREMTRNVDVLGRYGGEEFVVMLPETPIPNVRTLGIRILEATREIKMALPEGHFNFTVSIGITQFNPQDTSLIDMLKRADDALYEAKENGRDQIRMKEYE